MGRRADVWWNKQRKTWVTDAVGGKRRTLAKGWANKKIAKQRLGELLEEHALLEAVNGAISVAHLVELFLDDAEEHLAEGTYKSYRYACQKLVDHYGTQMAHTIRGHHLEIFSRKLKATLNPTSRAIVLRAIVRCFNWGIEQEFLPQECKLGRVRKPQAKVRERFLTDEEFQAILRATNAQKNTRKGAVCRRLLLAMEWTGARPGELSNLRWEHIRYDLRIAVLHEHKTKRATQRPKVIPLNKKMMRLIRWLEPRSDSDFVFLNSRGQPWNRHSIAKRIAKIRERCGLGSDVVPYTLRHRAATKAITATGDLSATSKLLNHTSVSTTQRYIHLASDALVDFSERALG